MPDLQLILVTPEKTLLDEPVESLRFPLYDGQIGILPGRAPLVGRLGYGELKVSGSQGDRSYFIDGGFVQVKGGAVSLLTNRALSSEDLKPEDAEEQLQQASERVPTSDDALQNKLRDQERARRMLALARKPR